ncbi:MAG: urease accessory protein UreF [Allorhizobium sp.]
MPSSSDITALLRLLTWLSPAFPVGAFAYSGGLERAVKDGLAGDEALSVWIACVMRSGTVWNDAVFLAEAHRAFEDRDRLGELADLAGALSGSRQRHGETLALGAAFLDAAGAWPHPVLAMMPQGTAYPVAVGAVAGAHGIVLQQALAAFLHATASQSVSAAIRLGVTGQRGGVAILADLEGLIGDCAARACDATLEDLGSATIAADIASLRHETQTTRLFRT